ncbi:MAG: hypothetical protein GC161_19355 [Planctomycetaceae bacterium]|nr:hypothetical protein [Planctomycetaceae bacterium]
MGRERWSIEIYKEYLKFSAAHFLIFPDGSAERLHGHNYQVTAAIEARLSAHGLVIDFKHIKPIVREIVDALDEHWLVPGQHQELRFEHRPDGVTEVRYRDSYYAAPTGDVIVLPINNTSAENFAAFIGRELLRVLEERHGELDVREARITVEETAGQRGVWRYLGDEAAG